MAPKSGKCGFSWLCCGSKGSVHPEPGEEDQIEPKPDQEKRAGEEAFLASPPPAPKHPGLLNSEMDSSDTCRYYCPLCMMYFEAVYETVCCGHTICDDCALGYMRSASISGPPNLDTPPDTLEDWVVGDTIRLTDGISALLPNACAFCRESQPARDLPQHMIDRLGTAQGFQLKLVLPGGAEGALRSYEDSPAAQRQQLPGAAMDTVGPSPLRVGDSFEKMRSKMIPFERPPPVPSGVSRGVSSNVTPRESPAGVPHGAQQTPTVVPVGAVTPVGPQRAGGVVQTPGAVSTPGAEHQVVAAHVAAEAS